jgi:heat shock protein HtpX
MNPTLRTIALFALLTGIFMGIGALFFYLYPYNFMINMAVFFVLLMFMNLTVYFKGDRMVLRRYGVREVTEKDYPELHAIVRDVARRAGVPKPRVGIMDSPTPNAFATGRNPNNSTVVVTTGILRLLSHDELRGVIAHEMAHIKDRDILLITIASVLASAVAFMARWFLWSNMFSRRRQSAAELVAVILALVGASIGVILIKMSISRQREFKADEMGARFLKDPRPLKNALYKLDAANKRWPMRKGNPASSSMFIVNPFTGSFSDMLSTHPPTKERIRRLEELESELLGYDTSSAKDASAPHLIRLNSWKK